MSHFRFSDSEFEHQFATGKFPLVLFNHEAHLRLAWIHIHQYGVEKAIEHVTEQIKAFVKIHGAEDKYNHTLTVAAVKAVNHFYHRTKIKNFENTILEFPRLRSDFKSLMETHYSFDIINHPQSAKEFLQPDLMPF